MLPSEPKPPGRRGRRIDNRAGDHVLPQFAGYMEGAVRSGFEAARACLTRFL
jgi:monoamine oxidase